MIKIALIILLIVGLSNKKTLGTSQRMTEAAFNTIGQSQKFVHEKCPGQLLKVIGEKKKHTGHYWRIVRLRFGSKK